MIGLIALGVGAIILLACAYKADRLKWRARLLASVIGGGLCLSSLVLWSIGW